LRKCFWWFKNRCQFALNVEIKKLGRMVYGGQAQGKFKDTYAENVVTGSANQTGFQGK